MMVLRERVVNRLGEGLIGFRRSRVRGANKRNLLCVVIKYVSSVRLLLLPALLCPFPSRVSTTVLILFPATEMKTAREKNRSTVLNVAIGFR